MGLVKTVVSPFTNTTSLVSIVLIIILIAVFRWDGGKLTSESKRNKENNLNTINIGTQIGTKKTSQRRNLQKNSGTIEINANEFDELMRVRKPPQKVKTRKVEKENSFDSIEADLGLR